MHYAGFGLSPEENIKELALAATVPLGLDNANPARKLSQASYR
jgi:hypothetical protein